MTSSNIKRENLVTLNKSLIINPKDLGNEDASLEGFFCTADLREILNVISEQEEALMNIPEAEGAFREDRPCFSETTLHPVNVPLLYAK